MVGNAFGAALAGLVANGLGASHGIDRLDSRLIATWLFVAAAPLALGAWAFAWQATRPARQSKPSAQR